MKGFQARKYQLILLFCLIVIFYFFASYVSKPLPELIDQEKILIKIPKGAGLPQIADSLKKYELIENKQLFSLWVTALQKDKSIKAGHFEIPKNLNYAQLVKHLSNANAKEIKITLIEGWTSEEIAAELQHRLEIDSSKFMDLCKNEEILKKYNISADNLEGYLLPDTYYLYWGMNEKSVLQFLLNKTFSIFDSTAMHKIDSLKMTVHQILTMASIIEGEAIYDDERKTIASVYYNRLRRRIRLQADPTIQYIIDGPPRRLLFRDLEIDSPYNTYKYDGLPPGPINNPGRNSIMAAIYPEKTDYIYFVARGDGRHTFSKTSAEHYRAKREFDKIRREVRRNRKLNKN